MILDAQDLLKLSKIVETYDHIDDEAQGTSLDKFVEEIMSFKVYESQKVRVRIEIEGTGENSGAVTAFDYDTWCGFFYDSEASK